MSIIAMLLLSALAAAFVLLPLVMRGSRQANAHDEAVKALYRQRVEEVGAESSREVLQEVKDELGAVLLTELPEQPARSAAEPANEAAHPGKTNSAGEAFSAGKALVWRVAALSAVLPVFAFVLYQWIADTGVTTLHGAEQVMSLDPEQQQEDIVLWRERLQKRVDDQADDHKSWYLLGHAELKLNNFAAAAQAFASTNTLVEDDLSVQVYWLQARYLAAKGVLDEFSQELAQRLLKQNPNLPVVLEMLAVDAYRNGRAAEAITLLNRAISGTSDPAQQASFAAAIKQVRSALDAQDVAPGVTVHASAAAKTPRGATLFVLARPVGGGMPYAVVKRPAALLPLTVQLDDLVSMSPARLLSAAEEFEVVVRVSKSGNAMPAADDWQWVSPAQQKMSGAREPLTLQAELMPPGARSNENPG